MKNGPSLKTVEEIRGPVRAGYGEIKISVYDPAMCCASGVCGPSVDPALVRFASDLRWLEEQGAEVRRFNLSQNPAAFVENEIVKEALTAKGETALPMVMAGAQVLTSGRYPTRDELALLASAPVAAESCCGAAHSSRDAGGGGKCCG